MTALISPEDLAAALAGERRPTVLDVRWRLGGPPGRDSYAQGHVPGAVFVDLDAELAAPPASPGRPGGRHPLPDRAAFESSTRRWGVARQRPVVVYDDADATAAARAWWLLRYFGHEQVAVLDGGFRAWRATGLPVDTEDPVVEPGDFTARPGNMALLNATGAAAVARDGVLLDARSAERYRGEVEPIDPVAGHIPGASSAPVAGSLDDTGRLLPGSDLRQRFASLGVGGEAPVGVYCGSGVSAAAQVLALELAGVPAGLYVGSWSDWISDPSRPVATG